MTRTIGLALVASVGLLTVDADMASADGAAAKCSGTVAYRGQPLREAPALPDVRGAIDGVVDATTAERLHRAVLTAQQATHATSMSVAVMTGAALWSFETGGAAGSAATVSPPGSTPLHYWASAGKTFIAIVVLQLVAEGKLTLADPVSRWIAGVPNGELVTIDHLLTHTSGLFSANEDARVRKDHHYHTAAENLAVAKRHGAMFCPGEAWRYSNTGYDLLGMIIERVDGRPYPAAITARIIAPLGLKRMRVLTPGEASSDVAPLISTTERPINPSWAGAAGAIVGPADEMLRVWHALLSHRLLNEGSVRRMFARLYPMFTPIEFYGLGVMCFDVPEADGSKRTWIGHAGGTPGASAMVAWSLADRVLVAVALTGDGSAAATVNLLLRELRAAAH